MDLKIIRLARRRMLITSKPKPKKITPLDPKPKLKLPTSHRRPK